MTRDKKDFDYWDKYYGNKKSNKVSEEQDSYHYSKKHRGADFNNSRSRKNKNEKYESRIVGSEYKVRKKRGKSGLSRVIRTAVLIIIVFFLGFFTFYAIDNELFSSKKKENGSQTSQQKESSEYSVKSEEQDTSASILATGEESEKTEGESSFLQRIILFFNKISGRETENEDYPDILKIKIYFVMLGSEGVFNAEERTINAGNPKNAVVNAVNELLKGPSEEYNFAVIPPGTKLLDVEIVNDIARINLSQEFLLNSLDTRILDNYIIYTIVNTLTEIKGIRAVTFLIDGKEIKEYGNVDLRLPAIRNEKYLEKS